MSKAASLYPFIQDKRQTTVHLASAFHFSIENFSRSSATAMGGTAHRALRNEQASECVVLAIKENDPKRFLAGFFLEGALCMYAYTAAASE